MPIHWHLPLTSYKGNKERFRPKPGSQGEILIYGQAKTGSFLKEAGRFESSQTEVLFNKSLRGIMR